jgi:dethiobiotin synthetase
MYRQPIFITAIGTDSGKTLVSAIFCEALMADYFKPVQAGSPTDKEQVKQWVTHSAFRAHNEIYALKMPASPHAAARAEGLQIDINNIELPVTQNPLIIEGAGGVLVPLNNKHFVIDLALKFNAKVVLVSNHYLGSINHTLCTVEVLKQKGVQVLGIVFNGDSNPETEQIILHHTGYKVLLHLPKLVKINVEEVSKYALTLRQNLVTLLGSDALN